MKLKSKGMKEAVLMNPCKEVDATQEVDMSKVVDDPSEPAHYINDEVGQFSFKTPQTANYEPSNQWYLDYYKTVLGADMFNQYLNTYPTALVISLAKQHLAAANNACNTALLKTSVNTKEKVVEENQLLIFIEELACELRDAEIQYTKLTLSEDEMDEMYDKYYDMIYKHRADKNKEEAVETLVNTAKDNYIVNYGSAGEMSTNKGWTGTKPDPYWEIKPSYFTYSDSTSGTAATMANATKPTIEKVEYDHFEDEVEF